MGLITNSVVVMFSVSVLSVEGGKMHNLDIYSQIKFEFTLGSSGLE